MQRKWALLRDELPSLQMTALTDSLELLNFERKVIDKSKSVVEELEALQKTVSDVKAAQKYFEK